MTTHSDIPPNEYLKDPVTCPDMFSPDECGQIQRLAQSGPVQAQAGEAFPSDLRKAIRYPMLPGPEHHGWVQRISELIQETNQSLYQFRLGYLSEFQIIQYQAEGFYDWHLDIGHGDSSTRKLSVVVFLTSPDAYVGGRIRFDPEHTELPCEQGSIMIFPSYLMHCVEPVTQGECWMMLAWVHGPAFF